MRPMTIRASGSTPMSFCRVPWRPRKWSQITPPSTDLIATVNAMSSQQPPFSTFRSRSTSMPLDSNSSLAAIHLGLETRGPNMTVLPTSCRRSRMPLSLRTTTTADWLVVPSSARVWRSEASSKRCESSWKVWGSCNAKSVWPFLVEARTPQGPRAPRASPSNPVRGRQVRKEGMELLEARLDVGAGQDGDPEARPRPRRRSRTRAAPPREPSTPAAPPERVRSSRPFPRVLTRAAARRRSPPARGAVYHLSWGSDMAAAPSSSRTGKDLE